MKVYCRPEASHPTVKLCSDERSVSLLPSGGPIVFELTIGKQQILTPLLTVAGAVDKKQSLPILSNILLQLTDQQFSLTATDLEIQITALVPDASFAQGAAVTVPAKKMIDIIRSLEDEAMPTLSCSGNTLFIKTEQSQFKLATLPAADYPIS